MTKSKSDDRCRLCALVWEALFFVLVIAVLGWAFVYGVEKAARIEERKVSDYCRVHPHACDNVRLMKLAEEGK